jgi:hypothetical protein
VPYATKVDIELLKNQRDRYGPLRIPFKAKHPGSPIMKLLLYELPRRVERAAANTLLCFNVSSAIQLRSAQVGQLNSVPIRSKPFSMRYPKTIWGVSVLPCSLGSM